MSNDLIARYSKPVPRYTSYPTAPHFHDGIDDNAYRDWLSELSADTALSLYVHVPFCDRLCWFCGCNTKQVLRYDPIAAYLPAVHREMETVAGELGGRGRTVALHFGGGSPSMLAPADLIALGDRIRALFHIDPAFEFSIEIDPNDMTPDRYDGFARAGVTRISVGLQDFDPKVQQAINRLQSFEQTRDVVEGMRARGVTSANLDILYGLPFQTVDTVERTVDQALSMRPDRIALFGYAHVPWMKTHQKMIDETALPSAGERLDQSQAAATRILAAGYRQIGIDHFALPADHLAVAAADGTLRRNFQGYTTDDAPALLGFGASSIGNLPQGYVQNVTATAEYIRRIEATGLAIARGIAFTGDDRQRGYVIERLMCDFHAPFAALRRRFGAAAEPLIAELRAYAFADSDQLVELTPSGLTITERGKPFVRAIAANFDAYLARGTARHSIAV
ncbi:MAG: oxygen-independent coproporphyrinogen III oxidase [Hyphomicrobiales bacterium]|nr:MAG: oxygen-independent coproporphyrinogen III oxidase [Hyphomicrobiales bacterium]